MSSTAQRHAQLLRNYTVLEGGPGGEELGAEPEVVVLGSAADLPQAYAESAAVLDEVVRRWGVTHAGYKISMTNPEDQKGVGASEPAYGLLTTAHLAASSRRIRLDAANRPLVEPELVVRANRELTAALDHDGLVAALDVTGGLEIPICRLPGWWPEGEMPALSLGDLVRDNAVAGYVVHADTWTPASELDLAAVDVELLDPAGQPHRGTGARVLGDPVNAVRWLVEALARSGHTVAEGSLVSSGTFMPPLLAVPGDFVATFSHDLGSVRATFT